MSWQQQPGYNPYYTPTSGAPPRGQWEPPTQSAPPPQSYAPPTGGYYQQPPGYQQQQRPGYQASPRPSGYGIASPSGYGGGGPYSNNAAPQGNRGPPPVGQSTEYGNAPPPPPPAASGYGAESHVGGRYPGPSDPPGMDPELYTWFQAVDADRSGKITAIELRQALLNNNWSHFNAETCRLLIGMFDSNGDGSIDIQEFAALWKYVQEWKSCFDRFDKDKSGNIDGYELQQALQSFGYRLSIEFCKLCTRVFDRNDKQTMKFDDFIQCCVMLKSLTEGFRKMDTDRSGTITVSYEKFLEMAVDNTM